MNYKETYKIIKRFLVYLFSVILGFLTITFFVLFFDLLGIRDGLEYNVFLFVLVYFVAFLSIFIIIYYNKKSNLTFKILNFILIVVFLGIFISYLFKKFGLVNKFSSVEEIRQFIEEKGKLAPFLLILLQFLQVVMLPIPSILLLGVGILLFGPILGALYSIIGIVLGSFVAYTLGSKIGNRAVSALIGKDKVDKLVYFFKNKSKIIIYFVFLIPFFPDDALCFVCGMIGVDKKFFILTIISTKLISLIISTLSLVNLLVPYNTIWGIIIWILIFSIIIVFVYFLLKRKSVKKKDKIN